MSGICTNSVLRAEKLPSSAEEGRREAPGWCWSIGIILLTDTTRASAFIEASPYRARASRASALPSSAEEGSFLSLRVFVQPK